ncbi:hypothetical protein EJ04DRAFT_21028 [Polyplosphaeria fusca]|uniref:Uncharacterized protein n=1 Tax=Polyplosphaeria fusca TaxID=682080 RepID=A0A9P4QUB9_9PLEO|nr:hypothetical protein EJ04DRAFT_21028 [Polyplosphaeria fusca]
MRRYRQMPFVWTIEYMLRFGPDGSVHVGGAVCSKRGLRVRGVAVVFLGDVGKKQMSAGSSRRRWRWRWRWRAVPKRQARRGEGRSSPGQPTTLLAASGLCEWHQVRAGAVYLPTPPFRHWPALSSTPAGEVDGRSSIDDFGQPCTMEARGNGVHHLQARGVDSASSILVIDGENNPAMTVRRWQSVLWPLNNHPFSRLANHADICIMETFEIDGPSRQKKSPQERSSNRLLLLSSSCIACGRLHPRSRAPRATAEAIVQIND